MLGFDSCGVGCFRVGEWLGERELSFKSERETMLEWFVKAN